MISKPTFLLGCALVAGCGPDSLPSSLERSIKHDAERFLDTQTFVDLEPVFAWTFADERDVRAWTSRGTDELFGVSGGELVIQSSTSDPRVSRPVDFDADTVDMIRVSMTRSGEHPSDRPQVFWARAGEEFSPERAAHATADGATGEYRFDVSRGATWSGSIGRIRFDLTSVPGRRVRVRQIEGLRKRIDRDALNDALEDSWKVDLGNDVRNGMLIPPDRPVTQPLTIGKQSEFRFTVGLWREVRAPLSDELDVAVRASFEPSEGEPRVLFDWQPRAGILEGTDMWHEVVVDLSVLAGQHGKLRLETHASGPLDLLRVLPVVADTEIVTG